MKKTILVFLVLLTCTAIIYQAIAAPVITVKIDIGKKSKNCTGFGVCSVTIGAGFEEKALGGTGEIGRDIMTVHLNRKLGGGSANTISLDEPLKLKANGRSFTILPGEHKIERGRNADTIQFRIQ